MIGLVLSTSLGVTATMSSIPWDRYPRYREDDHSWMSEARRDAFLELGGKFVSRAELRRRVEGRRDPETGTRHWRRLQQMTMDPESLILAADLRSGTTFSVEEEFFLQSLGPRLRLIVEMRVAGYCFDEIGERIGCNGSRVSQLFKKIRKLAEPWYGDQSEGRRRTRVRKP